MHMDLEERVNQPEREMAELRGEFGFITEQLKGVHAHLIRFESETRRNFETAASERSEMRSDIKALQDDVRGLRKDMPGIVGDAMRDALGK